MSGVNAYNNSLVTISDGTPLSWLNAQDSATVNIMEGNIANLDVSVNGVIYLSNGYIGELIIANNSKVAVSGGYIDVLKSRHNSEYVIRGGAWYENSVLVSDRYGIAPTNMGNGSGFRVCR